GVVSDITNRVQHFARLNCGLETLGMCHDKGVLTSLFEGTDRRSDECSTVVARPSTGRPGKAGGDRFQQRSLEALSAEGEAGHEIRVLIGDIAVAGAVERHREGMIDGRTGRTGRNGTGESIPGR